MGGSVIVRHSILIFGIAGLAVAIAISALMIDRAPMAKASTGAACRKPDRDQVQISAGVFQMGSAEFYEEEGPVHQVHVAAFSIDRYDVTNAEFARFVATTHYVTDAERAPDRKDYPEIPADKLVAGGAVFTSPTGVRIMEDPMRWWAFMPGADWRHPEGPDSTIAGRDNYPVVQVSYNDALAYAHWAGRDLPTEEQFEYAARGGLDGKTYGWGDDFTPGGMYQANSWQGEFPNRDTGADGFSGLAPVGCFPANGYGLYDMIGNVWKWTSTPYGPATGSEMAVPSIGGTPASRLLRTIKGGSYLCAPNYCRRYRPAARQPQESGFSAAHLGFRTVSNMP